MGCGTSTQGGNQSSISSSKLTVDPASQQEKDLLNQMITLGNGQSATIQDLLQQAQSGDPFALTPAAQQTLNQSFDSARQRFNNDAQTQTAYMAGGRGLRMSDTPISAQAMNQLGLGLADLNSAQANAQLNYGLQGNAYQTGLGLAAAQALPGGTVGAFNPLYNERMATGSLSQSSSGGNYGYQSMSPLQQVLMGTQAYNQFGQGTNQMMSAGMKMFGG